MKAQTSTEFVILTTFMLLVFLVFLLFIQAKMSQSMAEKNDLLAQNIIDKVIGEIRLAESVTDGYSKTFNLPAFLENGIPYTIELTGYTGGGEILMKYETKEKVYFFDEYVNETSTIGIGENVIEKKNGMIHIKKS